MFVPCASAVLRNGVRARVRSPLNRHSTYDSTHHSLTSQTCGIRVLLSLAERLWSGRSALPALRVRGARWRDRARAVHEPVVVPLLRLPAPPPPRAVLSSRQPTGAEAADPQMIRVHGLHDCGLNAMYSGDSGCESRVALASGLTGRTHERADRVPRHACLASGADRIDHVALGG